jgi:hypothetical protein
MLFYLHDGSYILLQNNAILSEQQGSFLSYSIVSVVGGKSWNVSQWPICQRVMQQTVMEHYHVAV